MRDSSDFRLGSNQSVKTHNEDALVRLRVSNYRASF